ncbi:DUF2157 domain-containing protein [Pseudochryseolinea flava]|uniref:DUF2157 domain-containing protein n=1 Tax=Pseudochryseolinea flava TaxID=2059302 RepID=A0A364Y0C6_9BACT|nr:DUF2157 domain-containing protein [Pseudochryseolinea flava]RAW00105.1 hypothetical protein DQQ10_16275 [Pseudochryseolinea flava]
MDMIKKLPQELLDKVLLSKDQFERIDPLFSGKLVSVFYDLRVILYLGVLLLTSGLGILVYQNIGDIGHLLSIIFLIALTTVCYWFVMTRAVPYSNNIVKHPIPYYDYIVLLASLLLITVLGYAQFQYEILDDAMGITTLITAAIFFYTAYRFDHLGVLSLGITAFASFWSISISPMKWYSGDFIEASNLHVTGIFFSIGMASIAMFLDRKNIKQHFTFSILNINALIFFVSTLTGLFSEEWSIIYYLLVVGGCAFSYYVARYKRSFLFLLYAFLAAYVATTYLIFDVLRLDDIIFWFFYSVFSCGGFVYFIVKFKNHFKR